MEYTRSLDHRVVLLLAFLSTAQPVPLPATSLYLVRDNKVTPEATMVELVEASCPTMLESGQIATCMCKPKQLGETFVVWYHDDRPATQQVSRDRASLLTVFVGPGESKRYSCRLQYPGGKGSDSSNWLVYKVRNHDEKHHENSAEIVYVAIGVVTLVLVVLAAVIHYASLRASEKAKCKRNVPERC